MELERNSPLLRFIQDCRNRLDFTLRSLVRWDGPRTPHPSTSALPVERREFLDLFQWKSLLNGRFKDLSYLTIVDIGAKDFFLASLLSDYFHLKGEPPRVIGIEVDGYRRYQNLQTRASLGKANARYIPHGEYRVMDFLDWKVPVDLAVLFGPFVTENPLRSWGLPTSFFQPQALFHHIADTLTASGLLLLSCPTEKEFELAKNYAEKAGLVEVEKKTWRPTSPDSTRSPAFGAVFSKKTI